MTKQHFELVARTLSARLANLPVRNFTPAVTNALRAELHEIAFAFAAEFAAANPRFDRVRFLTACGVSA